MMKVTNRFFTMVDPETGKSITVERAIVVTNKPTDAYLSFGSVEWVSDDSGGKMLDFSGLTDLDPNVKEFPEGMEAILLNCNMDKEYLPVKFNHPGIGNYSEVWIKAEDLDHVSGQLGEKVSDENNV